jgi:chromosome segregation ATPase
MSLKDFRTDASDFPREDDENNIQSSSYLQELNTLKIDTLSNRVTIISIMLPVLIGAVLFFIYLDIKDQVVDADTSKKNQVAYLARQSEEKLNALDMRIAKNRFDLDEKLPVLEKKEQSLENQLAKLAASKADTEALDTRIARIDDMLAKQDRRIQNNAAQDKTNLAELERINTSLLSQIAKTRDQFETAANALKQEIKSLAETMETKTIDLQRIQKDVSILDKQVKELGNQGINREELNRRFADIETSVNQAIKALETKLDKLSTRSDLSPDTRPKPQVDMDIPVPDTISEKNLTQ